ncbi:hypothetical protein ACSSS7_001984 [Eimeria intestinalis]
MGDARERSRGPHSGQQHRSPTNGGGSRKQQGSPSFTRPSASPAAVKAASPASRLLGGEAKRKQRASAASANKATPTSQLQPAASTFSGPYSSQSAATQAVPAAAHQPQLQQLRGRTEGQSPSVSANLSFNSSGATSTKPSWAPQQSFARQGLSMRPPVQQLSASDIAAAFQRSVVVVPGIPRLSQAVSRVAASRRPPANVAYATSAMNVVRVAPAAKVAAARPAANGAAAPLAATAPAATVAAAAPAARAPAFAYPPSMPHLVIAPDSPLSSSRLGGVSGRCGSPLQRFLMQDRPSLRGSGSSLSSSRDTPTPSRPPPVFKQAATHAEAADSASFLLRQAMEKSLETLAQVHKEECEKEKELQRQKEAQVNVILAKDKNANLESVVAMVIDRVLKVDVQCPIEAIKLFGRADQLLSFKERSNVQHHPSGELLLRTEDHMMWDEEGRAYLQRDAQRPRSSSGSFWTKHQSKVHASDRPAVLIKTPAFIDPLDSDINRRLPSLWEPRYPFNFQPFKLPAFAASSSPSEASPREPLTKQIPLPQGVSKTESRGMPSADISNYSIQAKQAPTGGPSPQQAKR